MLQTLVITGARNKQAGFDWTAWEVMARPNVLDTTYGVITVSYLLHLKIIKFVGTKNKS